MEAADALTALGIDEVIVFCVNDGAVMSAWAEDQKVSKMVCRAGALHMPAWPFKQHGEEKEEEREKGRG